MEERTYTCPVDAVLDVLGGKWKMLILWQLAEAGPHRYGALGRAIPRVSEKMLAQQLRQLEADGLVQRTAYAEVPPRVEYALTARGRSLTPHLDRLAAWAETHFPERIASKKEQASATAPSS